MKIDLSKKVVLITGASRGIGAAIAKTIGGAGGTVALHANFNLNKAEALAADIGHESKAFQANLGSTEEAHKLVRKVIDQYGKLDVVINNAGVAVNSPPDGEFNQWLTSWQETINVNLTASAIICREAVNYFTDKKQEGIIINVSSRAAYRGDTKEYLAYAASKGGVEALTKSIARAYGKQNIVCYGIAPGFTRTEMAQDFIDEYGEDFALNDIALPELTKPEDIAPLITFLASGLAKHATGATFHVNAGSYMH
ncbi:MAG: SDR family NAD(P)-dependent oxidoreductase [Candidatus Cyclobacteriaceae bacterium M2_1C_046]